MELDQEVSTTRHAHKTSETTSIANDGASELSVSSPVEMQQPNKRAMEHDSLVTVRLSEPPALHVNTTVPSSALPSRKSLFGREDTPIQETAEKTGQEEPVTEADTPDKQEATSPASDAGLTLQQELDNTEDGDHESGEDNGSNSSAARSSTESEAVDWEELQKTENQESKDQDSDNVCFPTQTLLNGRNANFSAFFFSS